MTKEPQHFMHEADIGSGEKSAAQREIEEEQNQINPHLPYVGKPQDGSQFAHEVIEEQQFANQRPTSEKNQNAPAGRVLKSGDHIARIKAIHQPDDTYEAQVYVRLASEPDIAETYIPAGSYGTEAEAWRAAEQRADRAFREHEF